MQPLSITSPATAVETIENLLRNHAGAAITIEYGAKARTLKRMKGADANAVLSAVGGRRG